jgi:hypothetical protein
MGEMNGLRFSVNLPDIHLGVAFTDESRVRNR